MLPLIHRDDLFSKAELDAALDERHVVVRDHPILPYQIYNYTEKAAWGKAWTSVTRVCRGLICHNNGMVIARPFAKFFNYGEGVEPFADPPVYDLDTPVEVTDKKDGSLGILYPTDLGYAIATRGSFSSEQAIFATGILNSKYADFRPRHDITYLFEIIYPENRIVLDYAGMEDLILLGGVNLETGYQFGPGFAGNNWPGPKTETFHFRTLREALEAPPRNNAEGLVIRFLSDNTMIKLKQDDYKVLHKVLTGFNEKSVWETLSLGLDPETELENLISLIPDEFHNWLRDTINSLSAKYQDYCTAVDKAFDSIKHLGDDRKAFAVEACKHPQRAALFAMLDGKKWDHMAWASCKPVGEKPFKVVE